jgi:hypothetical protein
LREPAKPPAPYPPTAPVKKAPFLPSESLAIRRLGGVEGPSGSGVKIYVFRDVLEELIFTSSFRPAQTSTGVLTGGFYEGPAGRYVEVRGYQDTAVVESTLQFAQRLRRTWVELWRDRALQEAGLLPLGWFVSRPSCDGRPGPFELITHLSFFNRPYHLMCVLDALSRRLGFYQQVGEAELANMAFNLIESAAAKKEQVDANH